MKRFARIAGIVVGSCALLILAGAAALRILLPPEKALVLLEQQLESRLGREVKLGSFRFGGLSTFRVSSVEISEPPTFAAGTFLTADAFEVEARLLPLLFRRLVVKSVLLEHPTLTLIRSADGRMNVAGSASKEAPAAPAGKPSDILISDVRLSRGSVTFVDKSTAALSAVLDPIDVRLSHVSLVAPIAVSGRVGVLVRSIRSQIDFDGSYDPLKGDATLDHLRVNASSATADVAGRMENLSSGTPTFTGTLTWKNLDPSSFTALIPIPDGLTVDGATSGRLDVSGVAPSVESKFEADFSQAALRWKDVFQKKAGVPLTARMALDRSKTGDLNLHDLAIRLASIELKGDGTLRGSSDTARTASFHVETNEFNVDDLFANVRAPMPAGVTMSGLVKATATVEGWTGGGRFVADFDGTGLSAGYGDAFRKAPGTAFRLVADGRYATPLAVDLSTVRLDLDRITLNGRGSYTTGKERPTYVFRLKTSVFPLTSLATLLPDARPYAPEGSAVVDMRVSRGAEGPLVSGEATLLAAGGSIKQSRISDLAGVLDFTNDSVTTTRLTGRLQGDPLQMSLSATRLQARPLIVADVRAVKLDIGKLLPPPQQKTELSPRWRWTPFLVSVADAAEPAAAPFIFDTRGSLRATTVIHPDYSGKDLELEWDLTSVTAEMDKMNGKAKLRQGPGVVKNLRALIETSKAARLILSPIAWLQKVDAATNGALKIPSLDNFPFIAIGGDYTIKNGVATVAPMTLNSNILESRVEGTVGLSGDQAANLRVVMTADPANFGGLIGQALAAAGTGKQSVPMTVTGPVLNPSVSVDKKVLEQKAKDVIRGLGESLFKALSK